jgi:hypothetical protein
MIIIQLSSCAVTTVYVSPNNFKNLPTTIFLSNGDSARGNLSLNNEVLFNRKIKFVADDGVDIEKHHLLDISSYKKGNDTYELKHVMHGKKVTAAHYFMKRLTAPDSRIQLYEHVQKKYEHRSSKRVTYHPVYYMSTNKSRRNTVFDVRGHQLAPNFHLKMSELVSDCASLRSKIFKKEEGYFYQVSGSTEKQRADILLRIINEYNNCK